MSKCKIDSLPPTEGVLKQHAYRTYLQLHSWLRHFNLVFKPNSSLTKELNTTDWGWKISKGELIPSSLPDSFEYKVVNFHEINGNDDAFNAVIRANITTQEDAQNWLKEFENINKVNFRVLRTYPNDSVKLVFKKDYRCHHNTQAHLPSSKTKNPSSKHVNCQAFLIITLKQSSMKR
ncbi:uncharacterized protein LOC126891480 [Diabrotica virgifera virgifera]|uniref:PH domain-containing protein n=1 Tax=Diabrotica virgifera virgifera TaxID=50390 RepID=A0ABM5L2F7_DIAVI|nr:uncharacterized protein LOC126891480 [Diabrotica virgifera virgifera]